MKKVKIVGFGHYCPDNIIKNRDIGELVDTSDEWIIKRTGIKERRISDGEGTVDLACKAALEALNNSNCNKDDIDLIVVATTSPDKIMPSTACSIQGILGCKNAAAFDVSAACSGFVYALIVASSLIRTTDKKRALVIGSEVLSRFVDWKDRSTCILFGDGAGAAIIEVTNEREGILSTCFLSDGEIGAEALVAGELELNTPFTKESIEEKRYIKMNGGVVFKFAIDILPKVIKELLDKSNEDISNIKYIVPHQANLRIIEESAKRLKIDKNKFYINLDKYGNTSAASIPIALSELYEKGLVKKGDKIILAAFGGGLTWAGALIEI